MKNTPLTAAELSYQLGDLPDRTAYLAAVCACLRTGVGGDVIGWTDIDLAADATGVAELWSDPPPVPGEQSLLRPVMADFPTIRHYRVHPDAIAPCRTSDLVPALKWREHRAYREFFRPLGLRHQLAIAVTPRTATRGAGWYLNRATLDFTESDMTLAAALQPVLSLLDRVYAPDASSRKPEDYRDEARRRAGLTPREHDILTLVADGLTAQQIATLRRISVRTVGKHLQNTYEKLGCHDRLQAANKARRLGLV